MPLRNVATTFTIEQQRLEINALAGDVNNISTGTITVGNATTATALAAGATGADLTLSGTLTVNGTQTILNTATLEVEDKNIVIAKGATTDAAASGGGITLKGANDKTISYNQTGDKWVSNKDFEAPVFYGDGSQLTGISVDSTKIETGNTKVETVDTGSDGHIKFTTEGTERLRITQDAGLTKFIQGATTTNSNTIFHVEGSSAVGAEFIGNNTQQGFYLALQNKNTNSGAWTAIQSWDAGGQGTAELRFVQNDNSNNQGSISFRTRNTGGSLTERLLIGSDGYLYPGADNTYDLGSTTHRWRNVYTGDLHLSNEGSGNDVDGTSGSWTMQEGSDDLFLINRNTGKKYKFNLTEVS